VLEGIPKIPKNGGLIEKGQLPELAALECCCKSRFAQSNNCPGRTESGLAQRPRRAASTRSMANAPRSVICPRSLHGNLVGLPLRSGKIYIFRGELGALKDWYSVHVAREHQGNELQTANHDHAWTIPFKVHRQSGPFSLGFPPSRMAISPSICNRSLILLVHKLHHNHFGTGLPFFCQFLTSPDVRRYVQGRRTDHRKGIRHARQSDLPIHWHL